MVDEKIIAPFYVKFGIYKDRMLTVLYHRNLTRVPTHTGKTGKPGKLREVFPVREF